MRVAIRRCFYEKIVENLRKRDVKKYIIYELDKPFPFYLLDLDKLDIDAPFDNYFKCVTIELWRTCCYNIVFYDSKGEFVTYVGSGFAKEKNAIEYFYELLLNISQRKGGEHNG